MLWKCCTHFASKFGKLSNGHRTGKGQFSFQSQRRAMPKNVHTTTQLHSSHTLAKQCSKFSKPGFNSTWTVNFQMFKLDLEKAEEPEIKWPSFGASLVAQTVKRLPKMWETWVQSLGQEHCLEKEMATHSIILAWKSQGQRSPVVHWIIEKAREF